MVVDDVSLMLATEVQVHGNYTVKLFHNLQNTLGLEDDLHN
jgi:hypothetical protein